MKQRNTGTRRTEHQFSQAPQAKIQRSQFNRSHTHKTTLNAGDLVPILVDEVLPGDTWNLNMTAFGRLSTTIWPVLDNLHADFFYFFVPNRLVWTNWPKFCGEQEDPEDSVDFVVPQLIAHPTSGFGHGQLMDYMGVPPTPALSISALPKRAYGLIWNEWFRDQNLQDSLPVAKDDGPDTYSEMGGWDSPNYRAGLQRRGRRHDYFTSCLPWPSKQEGVELPLGVSAPITGTIAGHSTNHPSFNIGTLTDQGLTRSAVSSTLPSWEAATDPGTGAPTPALWNDPALDATGLEVDLSAATAATINSLRQAFQIQKLFERDARGGTRYTELLRSHFKVVSPDARLQRSEYLGGGTIPVISHAVPQTEASAGTTVESTMQGSLSAFSALAGSGIGFNKSFTEHGHIIGLVSIRADLTYQQGIARMWSRSTRFDFYWPVFQSLGEQAVLNQEIYVQDPSGSPGDVENTAVFGYQERWAEYRYSPSRVSKSFRSSYAVTLDAWHLALKFLALPTLGSTFIEDTPPVDRVIAVQSGNADQFLLDTFFSIKCARPMPIYSVPGMIDHF